MPTEYDLSPSDAAAILGVHVDTITRWADNGTLPCFRTPGGWRRFRRSDIEAMLPTAPSNEGVA
jgi:excisionase family DNA binding protein